MSLAKTLLTVLGLAAAGSASPASRTRVLNLAPEYFNGTVRVENGSVPGNLDGFRMQTPAARSTSDFWYFDVFSAETNQTLNVVFFNSGDFQQYPHPLAVQVSGVFANGTDFYYEALADDGVTITNGPHGIKGDWKGIGSFKGSSLDKPDVSYSIRINSPDMGIKGTIKFYSIAPPRYPCAPNGAIGADQRLLPGLYWANAVPDSNARVSLDVQGTKIKFNDGVGYHDKNWGPQSIIDGPRYWDWGHGRLGPYSIVWYNLLDYHGQESRKSFVYKSNEDGEGEFLLLSCSQDSMKVRQKGGKAACPPKTGLLETKGLTINYTLDNGKKFNVDVTTDALVRDESGAYQRVNSVLKGGIEGEEGYTGKSHSEEFIFGIVNDYTPKTSV